MIGKGRWILIVLPALLSRGLCACHDEAQGLRPSQSPKVSKRQDQA